MSAMTDWGSVSEASSQLYPELYERDPLCWSPVTLCCTFSTCRHKFYLSSYSLRCIPPVVLSLYEGFGQLVRNARKRTFTRGSVSQARPLGIGHACFYNSLYCTQWRASVTDLESFQVMHLFAVVLFKLKTSGSRVLFSLQVLGITAVLACSGT